MLGVIRKLLLGAPWRATRPLWSALSSHSASWVKRSPLWELPVCPMSDPAALMGSKGSLFLQKPAAPGADGPSIFSLNKGEKKHCFLTETVLLLSLSAGIKGLHHGAWLLPLLSLCPHCSWLAFSSLLASPSEIEGLPVTSHWVQQLSPQMVLQKALSPTHQPPHKPLTRPHRTPTKATLTPPLFTGHLHGAPTRRTDNTWSQHIPLQLEEATEDV